MHVAMYHSHHCVDHILVYLTTLCIYLVGVVCVCFHHNFIEYFSVIVHEHYLLPCPEAMFVHLSIVILGTLANSACCMLPLFHYYSQSVNSLCVKYLQNHAVILLIPFHCTWQCIEVIIYSHPSLLRRDGSRDMLTGKPNGTFLVHPR